jgi:hypothetical protein
MVDITYQIVPHDEGWAYKLGGTLSETYATNHAKRAASRQKIGDGDATLAFPAPDGGWRFVPLETDKSGSRL